MRTVIFTSDRHSWLLRGFFHQWEKYVGVPNEILDRYWIEVAGFTQPDYLPEGVGFYSIGKFEDYPVEKWSDAVLQYLQHIPDELVLILLEDYWLIRPVNYQAINMAYEYMASHPEVIRFDVASDRMFNRACGYLESYREIDICSGKADYSLSFQASIYRRKMLIELLQPGQTPWETELQGTYRLNNLPYQVVGSFQWPMNYAIVMNKGKLDTQGLWMYPPRTLSIEDWIELDALGYLNPTEGHLEHSL